MNKLIIVLAVSVLLACYGAMHYYFYRKIRHVFPRHKKLIITTLLLLASSLILVFILSQSDFLFGARAIAEVSFIWMGYVFIFFIVSGLIDAGIKLGTLIANKEFLARVAHRNFSIFSSVITAIICFFGIISAQKISILTYDLTSDKLQRSVKVVQITDLHLGILSDNHQIHQLVNNINQLHPDITVSTGDLVDSRINHLQRLSATLSNLQAKYGKYAVYGNHEFIAGIEKSKAFTAQAGFTILSNRGVTVAQLINIVGIDDASTQGQTQSDALEKSTLNDMPTNLYTILLKHQPVAAPESVGLFDLQLSGHTHGGQIFPFSLLTKLIYPAPFGLDAARRQGGCRQSSEAADRSPAEGGLRRAR